MYKNPELSSMAKILARELKALGTEMKYTQALELVAKMQGGRNLHVHHAVASPAAAEDKSLHVLEGKMYDWSEFDSDSKAHQTERQKQVFDAKVTLHEDGLSVVITLPHQSNTALIGTDQLSLSVEIDKGRPVLEVSNDVGHMPPLRIISCPGGLLLSPTAHETRICSGTPGNEPLRDLQRENRQSAMFGMFVENMCG